MNSSNRKRSKLLSTTIDYLPRSNFQFNPASSSHSSKLVVLFGWLFYNERHLDKFRQLYLERGFDVLSVRVQLSDFLIPKSGTKVLARLIVRFLREESDTSYKDVLFHGFSIGMYQMGEVFLLLEEEPELRAFVRGIIMDSPVDVDWAPLGVSRGATSNPFLQWAIRGAIKVHFRLFYASATRHYIDSSEILRQNRHRLPICMLISKDDVVSDCAHMCEVVKAWQTAGTDVQLQIWEQSPHVSHYYKHPGEYRENVDVFLEKIFERRAS